MDLRQVDLGNIVGVVGVDNLTSRPLVAFNLEHISRLDGRNSGDVGTLKRWVAHILAGMQPLFERLGRTHCQRFINPACSAAGLKGSTLTSVG